MAEAFRPCPTTGLKVHLPAENLIKANAVAAVVFLVVGGLFGLMVALTRWPAVHLLPADYFSSTSCSCSSRAPTTCWSSVIVLSWGDGSG